MTSPFRTNQTIDWITPIHHHLSSVRHLAADNNILTLAGWNSDSTADWSWCTLMADNQGPTVLCEVGQLAIQTSTVYPDPLPVVW